MCVADRNYLNPPPQRKNLWARLDSDYSGCIRRAVHRYFTNSRSVHHYLALVVVSYALAENLRLSDLRESGVGLPISWPSTRASQALPTFRANAETFRPGSPVIAIFLPELLATLSPEKTVLVRN
jgi:hypothetical protein